MTLLRYPGGKTKLRKSILPYLKLDADIEEYREPFFGGGSIGLEFLASNPIENIWINDYDKDVCYLWNSVLEFPEELKSYIREYVPSVDDFFDFKEKLITDASDDIIERGFMKLALHQISYSGLGLKSGGPLGGIDQKSDYKIDCRWKPESLCKKIDKIHTLLKGRNWRCSGLDFEEIISNTSCRAFLYLDPPYYDKGNDLYYHAFSYDDHVRLAKLLKNTTHQWVLSYDDCPEIRKLYSWASIHTIDATYTITSSKQENGERSGNKKTEVVILPC